MGKSLHNVRVLFICSGTGRINRGIESFFREAFDGLKEVHGLQLRFLKGDGLETAEERVAWMVPRTTLLAKTLGTLVRRNGYVVEQWSSFFSAVAQIRQFRPHVVFYSEANLGFLLFRFRKWFAESFRLLFSNGAPVHAPFLRTDFVQQVAPLYYRQALDANEPVSRHFFVPYGITMVARPTGINSPERTELRQRLGIPAQRRVVLSVGWISKGHKRMDYVIDEIARLPHPRPYLLLVGAMDRSSRAIVERGFDLLGKQGFSARSVPYQEVFDYYRAADSFVLASLGEGFGRVYLEALMHGLPVIAHDNPVTRFVLGSCGLLQDLSRPGMLARTLTEEQGSIADPLLRNHRWQRVRDWFSWPVLAEKYLAMFRVCAGANGPKAATLPVGENRLELSP